MFSATGAWFLAAIAIAGALFQLLAWAWQSLSESADPLARDYDRQQEARRMAEAHRKATMWERSRVEREELMGAHREKMAAIKAKQGGG